MFDEDFNVKHEIIESTGMIYKLQGSKYVQSNINDIYRRAEEYLKKGKKVLFTGTPCQIEGIKSYLRKEYKDLFTQDIICHGVPSPRVWKKYKDYRMKKDKEIPLSIQFRNKDFGWKIYNMRFKYSKKEYKNNQLTDLYMRAFLQNISLRDSCYNCKFKKYNRLSDITLADFWGVQNLLPEIDDDKGVSLVIINSDKR